MKYRVIFLLGLLGLVLIFKDQIINLYINHHIRVTKEKPSLEEIWEEAHVLRSDRLEDFLQNYGVSPNIVDDQGNPLIFAFIQTNNIQGIKTLIKHGVNLNKPDAAKALPADYAKVLHRDEIFKLITDAGAFEMRGKDDPNAPYKNANNEELVLLFREAVYKNDQAKVKELLNAGLDPNSKDGNLPLLYHAMNGAHPEALEALLQKGVSMNTVDPIGGRLLFFRAATDRIHFRGDKAFDLFIDNGVDVNMKDKDGATLLTLIQKQSESEGRTYVEDKLKSRGAQ